MNEKNLCRRLSLCAELIGEGSRLADIGTDHAYLPIHLAHKGVIKSALACDIAEGPLSSARENIRRHSLEDVIEARLSDGLKNVRQGEADTVVIAGMGAELIIKILSDCPYIKDPSLLLILQPMTRYETLIRWLYENGFSVTEQKTAREGKRLYTVIGARYSKTPCSPDPLLCFVGKLDRENRDDRDFLLFTLGRLKNQAKGDERSAAAAETLEEYLYEASTHH